jgi:hypothetical protein
MKATKQDMQILWMEKVYPEKIIVFDFNLSQSIIFSLCSIPSNSREVTKDGN